MNLMNVGDGKVVLIAGGGKIYTDIAARFVKSEKSLEDIIASPYDSNIVRNIVNSGHKAAVEFDYFIFGVEGYSRVTEIQLARKRIASYMIKTGRANKGGKRSYDIVIPERIGELSTGNIYLNPRGVMIERKDGRVTWLSDIVDSDSKVYTEFNTESVLSITESWYNHNVELNSAPEEELRYLKPQATEFKALIGMNAHALLDWFQIRCCMNAQTEIRDMAIKMLTLCMKAAPDLFKGAGPNCRVLGYCPENKLQNGACKGNIPTKDEAFEILKNYKISNI